ncbi:MAG: cysteine desulfurase-like protein [Planctomycetota bacterium]
MLRPLDVTAIRRRFPGLLRQLGEGPAARRALFLDGPAGSQVPRSVTDAMANYLLYHNANHGGPFATSRETDAMVAGARAAFADLFGAVDPEEVVFGPNMTTLTFQLSRALARTWRPGDEVVVTDSDHDANVTPWVLAARDAGAVVRRAPVTRDGSLDPAAFAAQLSDRTRLCAIGAASNLTGTVHDVRALTTAAKARGALVFVDAVHFAAHRRMDVAAWGCDFAACSAYKFFGPHLGALWGRRALLEELETYKVRPAADTGAEKWQQGTANFEAIAGAHAAVEYLTELGREVGGTGDRRALLDAAFAAIAAHERTLCVRLLDGLQRLDAVRVIGLCEPADLDRRCATVSIVPRDATVTPDRLCAALAERGVFTWAGHSYALALVASLGLLPHGVLRTGLLHYHTDDEVNRLLAELSPLLACGTGRNP